MPGRLVGGRPRPHAILHGRFTATQYAAGSVPDGRRRGEGRVRRVGWLMVGIGLLVAVAGHYAMYSASLRADVSHLSVGEAIAGLCIAVVGLLLVQLSS